MKPIIKVCMSISDIASEDTIPQHIKSETELFEQAIY